MIYPATTTTTTTTTRRRRRYRSINNSKRRRLSTPLVTKATTCLLLLLLLLLLLPASSDGLVVPTPYYPYHINHRPLIKQQQHQSQSSLVLYQSSFASDVDDLVPLVVGEGTAASRNDTATSLSTTTVAANDDIAAAATTIAPPPINNQGWWSKLYDQMGTIDNSRLVFPELYSDSSWSATTRDDTTTTTRLFSSLQYRTINVAQTTTSSSTEQQQPPPQQRVLVATHQAGSVLGAAALVAGTTIGAGILALPTASVETGFIPSTLALVSAWIYMTMSGLLIAELTLNRLVGQTGKPGQGLLELYKQQQQQSPVLAVTGVGAYFFLHYAMMVAYMAQGGSNLVDIVQQGIHHVAASSSSIISSVATNDVTATAANTMQQLLVQSSAALSGSGIGQVTFGAVVAGSLFATNAVVMEQINNILVLAVFATFAAIVGIGAPTADFGALLAASNQHPEHVVNCLPILFLALVYQNIVPTVVTQLEGDRSKIAQAIVAGTTLPMLMFVAWNAVVLGNVVGSAGDLSTMSDPVALLQATTGATGTLLPPLVTAFSFLAIITSMIGFTYGLVDAWTDVFQIPTKGKDFEQAKLPLFALIFLPPLALSVANPDIFYRALEYGGAFGVSTLFLVLPPIMVWQQRYGSDQPLATKPMVPFGKLPLGSMWKVAATLMLEQTADKLGIFDYVREHVSLPQLF